MKCLKKSFLIVLWGMALMVLMLSPVWADSQFSPQSGPAGKAISIVAVGIGADPQSAEADAKRKAIEQAVGVYVSSGTEVENFQLIRDKIETHSQGFIQSMQVLESEKQGDEYTFKAHFLITREIHEALKEGFLAMGLKLREHGNPDIAVFVKDAEGYDPIHLGDLVRGYAARNGFYYTNFDQEMSNFDRDIQLFIADEEKKHPQAKKVQIAFQKLLDNGKSENKIYTVPAPSGDDVRFKIAKAGETYYVLFVKLRKLSAQEASLTVEIWQTATAKGEGMATISFPLQNGELRSHTLEKALEKVMQDPQKGALPLMYKYLNQSKQAAQNLTLVIENYNPDCGIQLRQHLKNQQSTYRNKSMGGGQAVYTVWLKNIEDFKEYLEVQKNNKMCIGSINFTENRIVIYFK